MILVIAALKNGGRELREGPLGQGMREGETEGLRRRDYGGRDREGGTDWWRHWKNKGWVGAGTRRDLGREGLREGPEEGGTEGGRDCWRDGGAERGRDGLQWRDWKRDRGTEGGVEGREVGAGGRD